MASKCPYRVLTLEQESNLNVEVMYFLTLRSDEEIDPFDEQHKNEEIELNIVLLKFEI